MQAPPSTTLQDRWRNRAVVAVFLILIFAPMLDAVFRFDRTPVANENRTLSLAPRFTRRTGFKHYFNETEAYFNDNFGLRNYLLRLNNKTRYALFTDQSIGTVLIGKNDWLFFTAEEMVEHYRGTIRFSKTNLECWQTVLEHRRDWLARRGIKYVFVVAPDKQSIYPEQLPDWLIKVHPETMLDQFVAHMKAHSTVEVLDLRQALIEARKIAPTYLRTDTHWNLFGGFIATEEIIRKLAISEPLNRDGFEWQRKASPGGDLVSMLGIGGVEIDEANYFTFAEKTNPATVNWSAKVDRHAETAGVAMLFHDSFGAALNPFLCYHFTDVFLVKQYALDSKLIEEQKPAVVISEIAERYFNKTDVPKLLDGERWTVGSDSQ